LCIVLLILLQSLTNNNYNWNFSSHKCSKKVKGSVIKTKPLKGKGFSNRLAIRQYLMQ
jgi:hypothetical protein